MVEVTSNWSSGKEFDRLNEVKDFIKFTIEFADANEGEKDEDI